MRRTLVIITILCLSLAAVAAGDKTGVRAIRMSDGSTLHVKRHKALQRSLKQPNRQWDASKTYRLPVILMSFLDCDFSQDDANAYYDRLFNESGFNLRSGPGSVADYFRDQSNGLFNLVFDVVGPIQVDYNHQTSSKTRYGSSEIASAVKKADELLNFADYDWYGNGQVETVIVVFAGYGGNESAKTAEGCVWPNTMPQRMQTADGVTVSGYSASAELWSNDAPCGIGTICHEFSHVLGLPDFYPTASNEFSVLDEWDLMDGGNYTDDGWCPPNYSIHEREYMGWQSPEELTTAQTITDMQTLGKGGKTYKIVNDANSSEYYLLENRQWEGWDLMLPGHGLLITHVDFRANSWTGNSVNGTASHHRLEYFHADGLDFNYFESNWGRVAKFSKEGRNLRLEHTAYPFIGEDGVSNDALTDTSTPAAMIFNARKDGSLLMGKSVMDIRESDGLISFNFSDISSGIVDVSTERRPVAIYDLQGRQYPASLSELPSSAIYIIRYSDGTIKKLHR
ncbi:MAG: M6 family metalloprotease domain-containing protein [Prevotella sp.]|nr:M6 family metalloprotease domain-containing protein [Prevotella sp.]